ncbi:MAG TPA: Uma2 family endonuclease [Anaerolineae bacterium]|nr:Uma2 family endonuclease [Anaerolineae bacterium]
MAQVIPLSDEAEARPRPTAKISFEDYLQLYDGTHAEWVDGEIEMGSPVSQDHADESGFLESVLRIYVEMRELGKVFTSPYPMRLDPSERGREPDLMFIANENAQRIKKGFVDGPADLVVEIISPESIVRDRGTKFVEYEEGGVREYWLIDTERRLAEFFGLGDDQRYHLLFSGAEGTFRSKVLEGFYLRVEWLWQQPLPKVATVLREMGIL